MNTYVKPKQSNCIKWKDNNLLSKRQEVIYNMRVDAGAQLPPVSTAARSMDYVIRMLIPFNFESFENKAVTLNIECSDIFGLKDITSISFNILDENDPPSSILSSKNYYKIEENAIEEYSIE